MRCNSRRTSTTQAISRPASFHKSSNSGAAIGFLLDASGVRSTTTGTSSATHAVANVASTKRNARSISS